MKCVSYTRTIPWKNHKGELTIADQNQRIAEYLAEHKELNLQKRYSDRKNAENAGAAFDKMIDDGVEQKFDCIIVASMYYCGPDFPAARQAIKETLYETGVNLIVSKEQWYVAKNTHPAIIARDDFEKVQDILAKNQKVFKTVRAETEQIRTEYQNDLAGMVFCADCGRPMDFDRLPHGAEESKKVCYYICRARQADDKCIGHQITEKLLKALVMDQLHLFIVRLSDKRKILEELRKIEDMQSPVYRAKSEVMSLTDKVGQMAKKREQFYADYVAGAVDSEEYQQIREEYSRQYDSLRTALQRAEAKKMEVEQQIREYLNMTSNLEEHLDDFGFDAQLVKSLVQRIEVSADKRIRIVFGFQDVLADFGKESAGK